jgi:hypothetical protein
MAHFIVTRPEPRGVYRFGSMQGKSGGARIALTRVHGYLKKMIEAIANSKVKRMQRELALRGIRYDRASDSWITRPSQPTERS